MRQGRSFSVGDSTPRRSRALMAPVPILDASVPLFSCKRMAQRASAERRGSPFPSPSTSVQSESQPIVSSSLSTPGPQPLATAGSQAVCCDAAGLCGGAFVVALGLCLRTAGHDAEPSGDVPAGTNRARHRAPFRFSADQGWRSRQRGMRDWARRRGALERGLISATGQHPRCAFTAPEFPLRKPPRPRGAPRTGAERTRVREHRTTGATPQAPPLGLLPEWDPEPEAPRVRGGSRSVLAGWQT